MNEPPMDSDTRRTLVGVIVALTVASIAFRLLVFTNLEHTSLVFIGIPMLLSLALVAVQPKTSSGTVHKTVALALCISGIVFGEGFICIVVASPLFFLIAAITSWLDERGKNKMKRLGILLALPLSLEGVLPAFELPRDEVVSVVRTVEAEAREVQAALGAPMHFDRQLPLFFRLGYPVPGATVGSGIAVGNRRSIEFVHGGHHPGALVLEVTSSAPNRVRFAAIADDSYITHWLTWRDAEVSWREIAPDRTEVTWTLRYRRRLDPAWYFKPLERYGVSLAAGYLIETLATPR